MLKILEVEGLPNTSVLCLEREFWNIFSLNRMKLSKELHQLSTQYIDPPNIIWMLS